MKTIEYHCVDKSNWDEGAWQQEPDKKQWRDKATDLPCLIVRGPSGGLCGYVGVSPSHPLHGKDYDAVDVDVHGGLTFANGCATIDEAAWKRAKERFAKAEVEALRFPNGDSAEFRREMRLVIESFEAWAEYQRGRTICHIADPGEPNHVWWFGFDCAHSGDYTPKYARFTRSYRDDSDVYRTIEYVTEQVTALAAQLAKAA